MSENVEGIRKRRRWVLTLDGWAVAAALLAALLVRAGVLKHVPW